MRLSSRFSDTSNVRPDMPYEEPRVTLGRIVDNRCRAIMYWAAHGQHRKFDPQVRFLLEDLARHVEKFSSKSRNERAWFAQLSALIEAIDLSKLGTYEPLYDHIGRPSPRGILGSPRR